VENKKRHLHSPMLLTWRLKTRESVWRKTGPLNRVDGLADRYPEYITEVGRCQ